MLLISFISFSLILSLRYEKFIGIFIYENNSVYLFVNIANSSRIKKYIYTVFLKSLLFTATTALQNYIFFFAVNFIITL